MLVDYVTILVKAGNGGNGKVSFKRNAQTAKGGPDGGNGGKGGDVYIVGVTDVSALQTFTYKKKVEAENGVSGGKQKLFGRKGQDMVINVPLGTVIKDLSNNTQFEINSTEDKILIAKGGIGGLGNDEFKSATNQTPKFAETGEKGEVKQLKLELKLIADIGLIGLPNAGKSSLLEALTNAHPKIGDYPFTTLEPNLGVMSLILSGANGQGMIVADIPGLIEGASSGKGLGDKFLRHIERTRILFHCIDSTTEDVLRDYNVVRDELKNFNPELLDKKEIILLTKIDKVDLKKIAKVEKQLAKVSKDICLVSIYDDKSLSELASKIKENL